MLLLLSHAFAADPGAGKLLFEANCTACHGIAGDGRGPAAVALKMKATDFTVAAWWSTRTDTDVAASIRVGKAGTAMSAFASLTEVRAGDIAAYLRPLSKPAP